MLHAPVVWDGLAQCSAEALRSLGFQSWDGSLMLIPYRWYNDIPEGFMLTCINGKTAPHKAKTGEYTKRDETDDDCRPHNPEIGFLAYGIVAAG